MKNIDKMFVCDQQSAINSDLRSSRWSNYMKRFEPVIIISAVTNHQSNNFNDWWHKNEKRGEFKNILSNKSSNNPEFGIQYSWIEILCFFRFLWAY